MKKILFPCLWATLVSILIFYSCKKTEAISFPNPHQNVEYEELIQNEATWISPDSTKAPSWWVRIKIFIGHTAEQCGGKCVKIFGVWTHIDCRGYGNTCRLIEKGRLTFNEETNEFIFTFLNADALGDDLDFPFPDRSFHITNPLNNEDLWLNVPEQILQRICDSIPFVIHDIWFSEEQELENR